METVWGSLSRKKSGGNGQLLDASNIMELVENQQVFTTLVDHKFHRQRCQTLCQTPPTCCSHSTNPHSHLPQTAQSIPHKILDLSQILLHLLGAHNLLGICEATVFQKHQVKQKIVHNYNEKIDTWSHFISILLKPIKRFFSITGHSTESVN